MWRERIQAARERGQFTIHDRLDAGCYIPGYPDTGYTRCAVGEQADRYGAELFFLCPEARVNVLDYEMGHLGSHFAGVVAVHNFNRAESLLDQIEDRALAIKRAAR